MAAKPTTHTTPAQVPLPAPAPVGAAAPAPAAPVAQPLANPLANLTPLQAAALAQVPVTPNGVPGLPVLTASLPVALTRGQRAVANGYTFAAPYTGSYVANTKANAAWPLLVPGGATTTPGVCVATSANGPGTVLVHPAANTPGKASGGYKAGHYVACHYTSPWVVMA